MGNKFNPKRLETFNHPDRLLDLPPGEIWSSIEPGRCSVLVDIGAGTGFFSKEFLPFLYQGKIYAADVSPVMVEEMVQGPRLEIRYTPAEVEEELGSAGFIDIKIDASFPYHFLVLGRKKPENLQRGTDARIT